LSQGLLCRSEVASEAVELRDEGGFRSLKLRLGREHLAEDLATIESVREAVGSEMSLMVDFNQGLQLGEAPGRCHAIDDLGLAWIEEPIVYDNLDGYARPTADLKTPVSSRERSRLLLVATTALMWLEQAVLRCRRNFSDPSESRPDNLQEEVRFAIDSLVEGDGFEPSVPREISDAFESAPRCKLPQSTPSNWVTACAVARRSCSSPRRPVWVRALDLGSA
jgi:hypothetical protein